ncbi:major facilitator superfamily transporter [Botrytis cinerea]
MDSVNPGPVIDGKPSSSLDQSHRVPEQSQTLSSQHEDLNNSSQRGNEVTNASLESRPNGIFIIEPNHPRTRDSFEGDIERSSELFDDKERQDSSALTSSANSVYVAKQELEQPPYHIFSMAKKRQLVYIVSLAGLFSPLSSNIYFPALKEISTDLNVSLSLVSLTVTVYMIVQGLAPSFWGPISDTKGRRITFMGTFIVYLASNIGLALSDNFATLMVFRAIQAAGSAATIAVGAGVIGDITTPKERGVFGGIITQYLGYRAIFWFLFGLGALALLLIVAVLPETLRSVAGNGSIILKGIHRPLFYAQPSTEHSSQELPTKKNVTVSSVIAPLKFLLEKDVFVTLLFGAIIYTVWSMVTSSTTALFSEHFDLTNLELGLIFLPNGAGCICGSYLTGYLMDYNYKVVESRYREQHNVPADVHIKANELLDFPIEVARMRNIWWIIIVFIVTTALYGYSLSLEIIALPLVLQFFIAYTATAVFSSNSALIIDLYPGKSASATAVNNLSRCLLGAAGVAAVQPIIDALGSGVTFLIFAGITFACSPLLLLEWYHGGRWRRERAEKLEKKEEAKRATDLER